MSKHKNTAAEINIAVQVLPAISDIGASLSTVYKILLV